MRPGISVMALTKETFLVELLVHRDGLQPLPKRLKAFIYLTDQLNVDVGLFTNGGRPDYIIRTFSHDSQWIEGRNDTVQNKFTLPSGAEHWKELNGIYAQNRAAQATIRLTKVLTWATVVMTLAAIVQAFYAYKTFKVSNAQQTRVQAK